MLRWLSVREWLSLIFIQSRRRNHRIGKKYLLFSYQPGQWHGEPPHLHWKFHKAVRDCRNSCHWVRCHKLGVAPESLSVSFMLLKLRWKQISNPSSSSQKTSNQTTKKDNLKSHWRSQSGRCDLRQLAFLRAQRAALKLGFTSNKTKGKQGNCAWKIAAERRRGNPSWPPQTSGRALKWAHTCGRRAGRSPEALPLTATSWRQHRLPPEEPQRSAAWGEDSGVELARLWLTEARRSTWPGHAESADRARGGGDWERTPHPCGHIVSPALYVGPANPRPVAWWLLWKTYHSAYERAGSGGRAGGDRLLAGLYLASARESGVVVSRGGGGLSVKRGYGGLQWSRRWGVAGPLLSAGGGAEA